MMLSSIESTGYPDDDVNSGQLLHDIEEISKALYLDHRTQTHDSNLIYSSGLRPKLGKKTQKTHVGEGDRKPKPKPGFVDDDEWLKEEKKKGSSSIWGWKPFKALSHIRQKKFTCCFFCHVHCIDGMPAGFDDVSVSVHWKRKDSVLRTSPGKVSNGVVEFEETLMNKCCVYGVKSGSGNFVKYEPKHFLLYASVVGAGGLDIGQHWVDLTRLLPLTFEELEEEKCSGRWSTSFKLSGKAKGATLHVSFAFLVTKDGLSELGGNMKLPFLLSLDQHGLGRMSFVADSEHRKGGAVLRRVGSVPSSVTNASFSSPQSLDVAYSWPKEVSDFSDSIDVLYGKLEDNKVDVATKFDDHLESLKLLPESSSSSENNFCRSEQEDSDFTVIEKGIELELPEGEEINLYNNAKLDNPPIEVIDISEMFKGEGTSSDEESNSNEKYETCDYIDGDAFTDKHIAALTEESNFEGDILDSFEMLISESTELEFSVDGETPVQRKGRKLLKSLSLDDISKAVVDDFFNLLQEARTPSFRSSNGDLESPRELLLREFEEDMLTSGNYFLGAEEQEDEPHSEFAAPSSSSSDCDVEDIVLLPVMNDTRQGSEKPLTKRKTKAKALERLETQSLMQRWGLNENAFQSSPHYSNGGFGSPIFIPPEEPVGLPPLGEGLGPLLHLKDGGLLRSMSPLLFKNAKNRGNLIMQASKPVVLPAELGCDIMEVLQSMASVGFEKLSQQLHKLMPLEDVSGRIIQQLAWEALESPTTSEPEFDVRINVVGASDGLGCSYLNSTPNNCYKKSGCIPVKDLAPLALDSVEVLMIEGLRIQSGLSDQDPPSSIKVGSNSQSTSRNRIAWFDDASDLLGMRGTTDYIYELLDLSISLDEWLKLDAGRFGHGNQVADQTSRVLVAHHAKLEGEEISQTESTSHGVLGNILTVAVMMQLRDPFRNYESVGAPMLGLIQVERFSRETNFPSSSEESSSSENGEFRELENEGDIQKQRDEYEVPRLRVKEVHLAGLNIGYGDSEVWACRRQLQSGSRWLLANDLTKNSSRHLSESRLIMRLPAQMVGNPWSRNFLWSISHCFCRAEADHSELSATDPPTRNPDLIFPEQTV